MSNNTPHTQRRPTFAHARPSGVTSRTNYLGDSYPTELSYRRNQVNMVPKGRNNEGKDKRKLLRSCLYKDKSSLLFTLLWIVKDLYGKKLSGK